jgi:hypothetical protein
MLLEKLQAQEIKVDADELMNLSQSAAAPGDAEYFMRKVTISSLQRDVSHYLLRGWSYYAGLVI